MSTEEYYDEDEEITKEDVIAFDKAISELEARCNQAGIGFQVVQDESSPFEKYARVKMPCGRDVRSILIWGEESANKLLASEFEKYVYLSGFEAICSYEYGTIEAMIRSVSGMRPASSLLRMLLSKEGTSKREIDEDNPFIEVTSPSDPEFTLSLSPSSNDLLALTRGTRSSISLKIAGISVSQHDNAVGLLKRYSNAFFFQINLGFGNTFMLESERTRPYLRRVSRRRVFTVEDLEFPKTEYDEAPLSLYWYGCSAIGMPLLQFLAFYQVTEFYFPTYSQAEARRRIRRIVKSPTFRPERDSDIGQILSSIALRGGGIGDERSQLRATINECIDPSMLREFLSENEQKIEFFASKKNDITSQRLNIRNTTLDLRNEVADRLYDIRCKIVHTKHDFVDGEVELLLPFSKEAKQLYYDIDLVQFIASQVLISGSRLLPTD